MRTLPSVKVFVQKLDHTIATDTLPVLVVPDEPTLDNIRASLQNGPLGDVEKDIFFPSWTKSIHVLLLDTEEQKEEDENEKIPTWEQIDEQKITVEDSKKLLEVVKKEEDKSGSIALILQECRSKRYTRKKENVSGLPFDSSPLSSPISSRPSSPKSKNTVPKSQPRTHSMIPPVPIQNQHMYFNNQVNQEPAFFYETYVPVSVMAPPTMYPPLYGVPVNIGMGCYNYPSAPAYVPQVYQPYYGYNVM